MHVNGSVRTGLDIRVSQWLRGAQRGKAVRQRTHGARAAPREADGGEQRGLKGKCTRDARDGREREQRRCAHAHGVFDRGTAGAANLVEWGQIGGAVPAAEMRPLTARFNFGTPRHCGVPKLVCQN